MQLEDFLPQFTPWGELKEEQKSFFYLADDITLSKTDIAQTSVLFGEAAASFINVMLDSVPGYSSTASRQVLHNDSLNLATLAGQANAVEVVRQWLCQTAVPVEKPVYLLYQAHNEFWVVATTWQILVRYWEAFTFSVTVDMLVLDSTKDWLCRFQMEVEVVSFIKYESIV